MKIFIEYLYKKVLQINKKKTSDPKYHHGKDLVTSQKMVSKWTMDI